MLYFKKLKKYQDQFSDVRLDFPTDQTHDQNKTRISTRNEELHGTQNSTSWATIAPLTSTSS